MNCRGIVSFVMLAGFLVSGLAADPVVLVRLQKPPQFLKRSSQSMPEPHAFLGNKLEKLTRATPFEMSEKLLKYRSGLTLDGFLGLYAGYAHYSGSNGWIEFPLRHAPATKLYIVVTPSVVLERIAGNTISHINLSDAHASYVAYLCEKKKDRHDQDFWSVQKTNEAVVDGVISPLALVIVSDTQNIFVAPGDYRSVESANVVLPLAFYVVGRKKLAGSVSSTLDIMRFFEPIQRDVKQPTDVLKQELIITS